MGLGGGLRSARYTKGNPNAKKIGTIAKKQTPGLVNSERAGALLGKPESSSRDALVQVIHQQADVGPEEELEETLEEVFGATPEPEGVGE